ncbi:unnamed protein product, partial [Didymodactylos carnosus]
LVEYSIVKYNSQLFLKLNIIRNNYFICLIAYAFIMSGMLMSISILLSISIDKYIYIFKPYKYPKIVTKKRCLIWILSLWLMAIVIGTLPLFGWNKMKRCKSAQSCSNSNNVCLIDRVFTTDYCSLFATCSLVAAIVILYIYVRIFFIARDHVLRIEQIRDSINYEKFKLVSTDIEHNNNERMKRFDSTTTTTTTSSSNVSRNSSNNSNKICCTPAAMSKINKEQITTRNRIHLRSPKQSITAINNEKSKRKWFQFSFDPFNRSNSNRQLSHVKRVGLLVNVRRCLRAL